MALVVTIGTPAVLSALVNQSVESASADVTKLDAVEVTIHNQTQIEAEITVGRKYPTYTGNYDVTPSTYDAKTLPTKGSQMLENITVQKIPQFLVSNDDGGKTLIIGDEYYG